MPGWKQPITPGVGVENLAVRCPHILLIVLDIGHIGGYTYFKQMFEYGAIYHRVNSCRNIDNSEK